MSIEHTFLNKEGTETRTITKAKAIRIHCMGCCGWSQSEVAKCTAFDCVLFPFRFGNEKGLQRKYVEQNDPDDEELDEDEEWDAITSEEEE